MAFNLTKLQDKERAELVAKLNSAKSEVEGAIDAVNSAIANANAAITAYNEALTKTSEFVTERKDEWQSSYDEKSEKWQEGERGEAAAKLIGAWDNIDLAEVDALDEVNIPVMDHAIVLEELPAEAE